MSGSSIGSGPQPSYATQILVGDFNGDGRPDAFLPMAAGNGSDAVPQRIFLGVPGGAFVDGAPLFGAAGMPLAINPTRGLIADFNGDGRSDVILLDHGAAASPVGGFSQLILTTPTGLAVANGNLSGAQRLTYGGATGDIDGDGDIDAVLFNLYDTTGRAVQVMVNDGFGNLAEQAGRAPLHYQPAVGRAGSMAGTLFDADGDGDLDLLAGTWFGSDLPTQIFRNDGTGSFTLPEVWNLPPSGVANEVVLQAVPMDLNGDGLQDLVLAVTDGGTYGTDYFTVSYLQFLVNRGNGQFDDETALRLPQSTASRGTEPGLWPKSVLSLDLDLDGDKDLLVWRSTPSEGAPFALLNDGAGRFAPGSSASFLGLGAADMNLDAIPELLVINEGRLNVQGNGFAPFSGGVMSITRDGGSGFLLAEVYAGPVDYLQYVFLGSEAGEAVGGTSGNDFMNLLGGDDAANGGAGRDVLDGGGGSNFLTGGAGLDVFFLDGRAGATTWSTITDWESGEQLSMFGYRPGVSTLTWVQDAGTEGYRGLTMHGDLNGDGAIETSVTWSGLTSQSQLPSAVQFDGLLWFT
ncbi:FG-GAP-like repeat-containing protein [Falsiroseomonas sp. E2-1-a20]|uniref:FG-GAP repeat domain-containing protein n=1 Tax=Falsiroseomonas sp. E2-1-a20 TaxID=3239300 RepID=UPI003F3E39D6